MNPHPLSSFSLSGALLTTPLWTDVIQIYSTVVTLASMTVGLAIGVITLMRMLRWRRKP